MELPPTPHYHVVSPDFGEVWTDRNDQFIRDIGHMLRGGGSYVEFISCPAGSACPQEIMHRWETGRAPTPARVRFGRRPKKSLAHQRVSIREE